MARLYPQLLLAPFNAPSQQRGAHATPVVAAQLNGLGAARLRGRSVDFDNAAVGAECTFKVLQSWLEIGREASDCGLDDAVGPDGENANLAGCRNLSVGQCNAWRAVSGALAGGTEARRLSQWRCEDRLLAGIQGRGGACPVQCFFESWVVFAK
jgi:hypothetical protein